MTVERARPQDSRDLIHAYLDGELSLSESIDAERAIAADRALAGEAAAVGALKRALQTKLPPVSLPSDLAARITSRVGLARRSRPTWMVMAASVVLAAGLSSVVTWIVLRSTDDAVYAESVNSHLRALMATRPVEIISGERHAVKPWFNGKSMQAPKVADLSADGFPLVGGRIDVIQGAPIPTLVYNRRLHTISVWAATDAQAARLTKGTASVNGTNLVAWRGADMIYWAASDLNAAELATFARAFAAAP